LARGIGAAPAGAARRHFGQRLDLAGDQAIVGLSLFVHILDLSAPVPANHPDWRRRSWADSALLAQRRQIPLQTFNLLFLVRVRFLQILDVTVQALDPLF
jgi:hypothetical protein